MRSHESGWMSWQACRWLAGLEAGVWAGLATLGWFVLTAVWSRHSIWEAPNRLGSLFYGVAGRRAGFHAATAAGLAFHVFTSGVVGLLFASVARQGRNRVRTGLLGMVTGLAWCYLAYGWFWGRLLPPGGLVPPPWLLAAYVVFGAGLGSYPGRLRSVERHFLGEGEPASKPRPGGPPQGE